MQKAIKKNEDQLIEKLGLISPKQCDRNGSQTIKSLKSSSADRFKRKNSIPYLWSHNSDAQKEQELLTFLIKEKERKDRHQKCNDKLQKLYDQRLERKRAQYEKHKARLEFCESRLKNKDYLSDDEDSQPSNLDNSFDIQHF